MIKAIISDFSRVLLFPRELEYKGSLNERHRNLQETVEKYNVLDHFLLNKTLLDFYESLKGIVELHILTTENIQDEPSIRSVTSPIFKSVISSKKEGFLKSDPETYKIVCAKLHLLPEEVIYVDDLQVNITAAKTAGLSGILFTDNESVISEVTRLLKIDFQ